MIDAFAPIRDNSFLWHIRSGSLQMETARVLTEDPFSFTMAGVSWRTQSWLAELVYGFGEQHSDLGFVPWMMLPLSVVTMAGIGLVAYRRSRSVWATAVVSLLSVTLLISFLVPRPVLFSYALFALVLVSWDRPATRWALPFLFWLWASTHGSFVLGLAYIGLMWLAEKQWKQWPILLMSGLVTLLTAHGLGLVSVLLEFSESSEALDLLTEWRKPELISYVFLPFVIGIVLIIVGAARRLIEPRHLWVLAPFLALGLTSTRAVPAAWFGIVPLVAMSLRGMRFGREGRFSRGAFVVFSVFVAVLPFVVAADATLDPERFPVEARLSLDDTPLFHDDRTGGYLIYQDWPDRLVYLDDRAELYKEKLAEFVAVRDGDIDWEPVFERDGIQQALLRKTDMVATSLSEGGWVTVFEDENFVVLKPQ
ncbi:MAG: hypothetical protein WBM90_10780 [Acidimicrobiia bacterium]